MGIKNFDAYKATYEAVSYNCIDASRAFAAILPILDRYVEDELPTFLTSMVHHTIRSGLMSICRVWDEDARSLKDLAATIKEPFVALELQRSIIDKLHFHYVFDDGPSWIRRSLSSEEIDDEATVFSLLAESISDRFRMIISSRPLTRLRYYRRHFLAHTSGRRLKRNQIIVETDYRFLLNSTVEVVDMLGWLLKTRHDYLRTAHDLFMRDAEQDWRPFLLEI